MKKTDENRIIVLTSGGFDPLHIGHVRLFKEAKELGDHLIVLINNDNWLMLKKGFVFMPQEERKEIIESIKWVDEVRFTTHEPGTQDISICKDLKSIKPDIFAKGGDRHDGNIPETPVIEELKIKVVNNVGGGKIQSSSWLVDRLQK